MLMLITTVSMIVRPFVSGSTVLGFYLIGIIALFALLLAVYLTSPSGAVEVNEQAETLLIGKRLRPVRISRSEIRSIRAVGREEQGGMYRLFGNGGWFGWSGLYGSKKLGRFQMIATKRDNLVMVETQRGKRIVFSVDDVNGLLTSVSGWSAPQPGPAGGRA